MRENNPKLIALTPNYLVVDKPRGLPVDMGHTELPSLSKWVTKHLQQQNERINKWGVHPVHFIDRSVGGLVLFARKKSMFVELQRQFLHRKVEKIYLAQTETPLPENNHRISLFHQRSDDGKRALIFSEMKKGTKPVDLRYELMENGWYMIKLGTGKYHQIRSMLAFLYAPIKGDTLYNGANIPPDAIELYAYKLTFTDPEYNRRITFVSRMLPA